MGTADELFARHFGCCWLHKETWRSNETNNTRSSHTSCKVHWGCWQWNFGIFVSCNKFVISVSETCHLHITLQLQSNLHITLQLQSNLQQVISLHFGSRRFCICSFKHLHSGNHSAFIWTFVSVL
jgi:hypothetical protein